MSELSLFLEQVTTDAGIYQMFDKSNTVLYVGKAKNLKKRLSSYFNKTAKSVKTHALVRQIDHIEVTITRGEIEALLLESNLIKSLRPKYNILMRDDKSYACIATSKRHPFPRLISARSVKPNKDLQVFGPYPSGQAVRETLNVIQKLFKIRNCTDVFFQTRTRPCLQYQIKRCSAPCVGNITQEAYQKDMTHALHFLQGKSQNVIEALISQMDAAVTRLAFEEAAIYRDQINKLRHIQAQQGVIQGDQDLDAIALEFQPGMVGAVCVTVRGGQVIATRRFFPEMSLQGLAELESEEQSYGFTVLMAFIRHYYLDKSDTIPSRILLNTTFPEIKMAEQLLSNLRNGRVEIQSKPRGSAAQILDFAVHHLSQAVADYGMTNTLADKRRVALAAWLNLESPQFRMECFDISHTQGKNTVASCVVFDAQGLNKQQYRRYNITGIQASDDYAAMRQVLTRRFKLLKEETPMPQILVIDGGKGQVSVAIKVLESLGITGIQIIGIAKGPSRKAGLEKLIVPPSVEEQSLPSDSPALHLLQQIRDESHRFAITGHRNQRQKSELSSTLMLIEGVGSKRRSQLLKHFGGIQALTVASIEEIARVSGISLALATKIYQHFH